MILHSTRCRAIVSTIALSAFALASGAQFAAAAVEPVSAPPVVAAAPAVATAASSAPVVEPPAPAPAVTKVRIPEGTEVHVHLDESLSSATASTGDVFSIVSDEEFTLPDGTVIPAGYSGKGEVTQVEKTGMLGKAGQLSVKLDYLKIGGSHIHLRATKSSEGKSNVTTMVVTAVLLTPLFLFIHGHSMIFPKGQAMVAYVDEDSLLSLPLASPPQQCD